MQEIERKYNQDVSSVDISFIIPVYNEVSSVRNLILDLINSSVAGQTIEVIIVDGESNDGTVEVVSEMQENNPLIHLINNPKRITPKAMNLGISAARGNIIGIMGARCRIAKDYTAKVLRTFEEVNTDVVGGRTVTEPGANTRIAKAIALATSHPFGRGGASYLVSRSNGYVDTVAFGNYRREIFDNVGKFNELLVRNQDNEFNYRVRKSGYSIYLNTDIEVIYLNRTSFCALWQQSYSNGKWNVRTWQINPHSFAWRHFIPMAFISSVLLSLLCGFLYYPFFFATINIMVLYFLVAVYCSFRTVKQKKFVDIILVLTCFAGFHVYYGVGTLLGFIFLLLRRFPGQRGE